MENAFFSIFMQKYFRNSNLLPTFFFCGNNYISRGVCKKSVRNGTHEITSDYKVVIVDVYISTFFTLIGSEGNIAVQSRSL